MKSWTVELTVGGKLMIGENPVGHIPPILPFATTICNGYHPIKYLRENWGLQNRENIIKHFKTSRISNSKQNMKNN